ncbi:hypothetical protein PFISCL1PPCAC_16795, partial [Pristionchus fissidentatus]
QNPTVIDKSPNVSSFSRSRPLKVRSVNTSRESYSLSVTADEETKSPKKAKKKEPSSHSSYTSYGVMSLPEMDDYDQWITDHVRSDFDWIYAMKKFNASEKTWKRRTAPARIVRRIRSAPTGLNWTQCAREVHKRSPSAWSLVEEWPVDLEMNSQLFPDNYPVMREDYEQDSAIRFSNLTLSGDDDVSTAPERSEITG